MASSHLDEYSSILDVVVPNEYVSALTNLNLNNLIIFDCRSATDFHDSHVKKAYNLFIQNVLLRRLHANVIPLSAVIPTPDLKRKIAEKYRSFNYIIYGYPLEDTENLTNDILFIVVKRLREDGCSVVVLEEGFDPFLKEYPHCCEGNNECFKLSQGGTKFDPLSVVIPLTGSTPEAASSPSTSGTTWKKYPNEDYLPVEIFPFVYLGDKITSSNKELIDSLKIRRVVNVTPSLPNIFKGFRGIKYLRIPVTDSKDEKISIYFEKANKFIEKGVQNNEGVLVHCAAGISRSTTILMAYLLSKFRMDVEEALAHIRRRRSKVAPNSGFMQQLQEYQDRLKVPDKKERQKGLIRNE